MTSTQPTSSFPALFARVCWIILGPMLLTVLALVILRTGTSWFTTADLAFLVVLSLLPLARWIEFRGGHPQTSTGEPAAPDDLRWYVLTVLPLGIGVWVIINLIANHWLAG